MKPAQSDNLGTDDIEDLLGVSVATADGTVIGQIDEFRNVGTTVYAVIEDGDGDGQPIVLELAEMTFADQSLQYGGIDGEDFGDLPGLEKLEEPPVDAPRE